MVLFRYIILFLVGFCSLTSATGQDFINQYIGIPLKELSVEQYLQYIERTTGYKLTYSDAILKEKKIALEADSLTLKELLDTLFSGQVIQYIRRGNLLIMSPQAITAIHGDQIKVSGIIKSAKGGSGIANAAIFVPNESIGTMTNSEGAFELYLPANRLIDTLIVSCIGFLREKIFSSDFLSRPVEIILQPNNYIIQEVIVRPLDPVSLLYKVLDNKADNYGTKPVMITAFFREATKQDNKYISLSEAVIDILKNPYTSFEGEDLVRLKKGRKGTNTKQSELVNLIVEGGLYNNMQLDIMKYGVSFLNPEYFNDYHYTLEKQITHNDRQTYIINFTFRNSIPEVGFDGEIYIDVATLAVTRAEFEISPGGIDYAKKDIVKKTPLGFRVKPKFGRYEVDYRFYEEKWHLMHARSEMSVRVKKEKGQINKGFTCVFNTTSEFVVTGTVNENYDRIKYREASKPNDILYQQITSTDPDFWGNENIILPDEPLQETIDKLMLESKDKNSLLSTQPLKKAK